MSGKTTGGPRAAHTANHAERAHAVFAPSAAERWINCPDSIRAQEGMKDTPSAAALEGTQCHEAASAILEGETFSRATRDLTNEQTILVAEYVDAVQGKFEALLQSDRKAEMIVEQRMRAPLLHPDYHGTGDGLMVTRDTLHVDDLKCGYGPVAVRYPDGRLNSQLGSYVLLALAHLGVIVSPWVALDPETIGIRRIFLTVHQPRVYDRPETTRVSVRELQEFLDTVVEAIERVESGDRTRKAGEWCKFCLALGRCPTARNAANEKAKADFSVGVENYTLDEMAEILQEAGWLERQLKGAKATVFNALRVGRNIEGSKLVAKKGRKRWVDWDEAQAIGAELGFGVSDLYKMEPISPAQFIALIRAKRLGRTFEWKEFNACYVSESSGYTLVPADDPRPAAEIRPGDDFPDDLPGDDDD